MPNGMQPQPAPSPQGQATGGASKLIDIVTTTSEGMRLTSQAFAAGGAPPQAIEMIEQAIGLFEQALDMAGGGAPAAEAPQPSAPAPAPGVGPEAGGAQQAAPLTQAMRS